MIINLVIWIICIISLILNCVRKNIGKAVFSGVGLIAPPISILIYSLAKTMYDITENGMSICIFALAFMLEVVVGILAFIFCFSKNKSDKRKVKYIISKYSIAQIKKIQDFLFSEIDDNNLQETIDFITSDNKIKKIKYADILYTGDKYKGIFIEGNQYLISSDEEHVFIIDYISEDMGVDIKQTRISFTISDFIELMKNKKIVLDYKKYLYIFR